MIDDGPKKMRDEAERLLKLVDDYPNGRTKAVLLRAAADILEHCALADDELRALHETSRQ